jgi:site-specific recombinase XerD
MVAETRLLRARQSLLKKVELHLKKGENLFAEKELGKTLLNATDFLLIDFLYKVMKGQRSGTTLVRWKMTKSKILNFLWWNYRKADLLLTDIAFSFADRLFDHLTTKDACGYNAAMKHIKNVKQIIDLAVNNDWITRNPIGKYRCIYVEQPRHELDMHDILKLLNADLGEPLSTVRDVFLFCCFTGFAYEDARKLKEENLILDSEGKKWISAKRSKTNEDETVPVLPLVEHIMIRYQEHPARVINGYLVPTYSNQYNNDQLKKIASACDIQKELTSHIARYTFAITVCLENGVPLNVVSKLLGHRSIRTTEKYAKVTFKKISDNMQALSQKLFTIDGTLKIPE